MSKGDFVFAEEIKSIAFGSCHKSKYADPNVWKTIAGERPQAFVWTGDAVYPPVRNIASLDLLAKEYSQMLQNDTIGYKQFLDSSDESMQVWGTYDDHDYGGNDRGHEMPNRADRSHLFWNFLNATRPFPKDDDGHPRQGLYYSVVWSNVRLIFLDTRWHRQHHCIPSVAGKFPLGAGLACLTRWLTAGMHPYPCLWRESPEDAVLGPQQWKWLQEQLAGAGSHQLDIVVSSIQVLTTNPAMERYAGVIKILFLAINSLMHVLGGIAGVNFLKNDIASCNCCKPLIGKHSFYQVTCTTESCQPLDPSLKQLHRD